MKNILNLFLCLMLSGIAQAATSITIANPIDGDSAVFQRKSASNTVQDLTLTGTYSGTAPSAMDCKALIVGGGTALNTTVMTGLTANGGNWSGTCPGVPQGSWYNAYAQDHNTTSANATQTQQFCVGVRILLLGVSVQNNMFNSGTLTLTPSPYVKQYMNQGNAVWESPITDPSTRFLNNIQTGLGGTTCVGTFAYFILGASLGIWSTQSSGQWTHDIVPSMPPAGADAEFVATQLSGASSDGNIGTNPDTFFPSTYAQIVSQIYTLTGRNSSNLWFGITNTGYTPGTSTYNTTAIRYWFTYLAQNTPGYFLLGSYADLSTSDGSHPTEPGNIIIAQRWAQAILYKLGLSAYDATGPRIQRFTRSANVLTFTTVQPTGTGLAFQQNPAGIPDGFYISTTNVCDSAQNSEFAISSYSIIDANHFSLTLSTTPSSPVYVCYQAGGQNTQGTNYNLLFGTPNVTSSSFGNPALPDREVPLQENQKPDGPGRNRIL